MSEEITWGGFFRENIRRWVIEECLTSGDPENFFLAIRDELETLEDDLYADPSFWERVSGMEP